MINCVYRTSGLGRGSPQAAFQYMSDRVVVPKFGSAIFPPNCRDGSGDCEDDNPYHDTVDNTFSEKSSGVFHKFMYLWEKSREGVGEEDCDDAATFQPLKTSIPAVAFLPGKAYIQFADLSPEERWVISGQDHDYLDTVRGETIAKPLIYKKGPLAVMMVACYELFYTTDGVFNFDCSTSTRRYLPQWVILVSYGTNWFGTVMPKMFGTSTAFNVNYPTVMRISRLDDHNMFLWNSFVVPRVSPYENNNDCTNKGISLPNGKCFCSTTKYGSQCQADCTLTCKNGGKVSHVGCKCECPGAYYGKHCGKECECGDRGQCDVDGNCICHRQVSWGASCENICTCNNNGYCHNDGSCECLGSFAGPKCDDVCTKQCTSPEVCRFSNAVTDSGDKLDEFCACPHGFYGKGCNTRIDCRHGDQENVEKCRKLEARSRCKTEDAMRDCPNLCGHCFRINTATSYDV